MKNKTSILLAFFFITVCNIAYSQLTVINQSDCHFSVTTNLTVSPCTTCSQMQQLLPPGQTIQFSNVLCLTEYWKGIEFFVYDATSSPIANVLYNPILPPGFTCSTGTNTFPGSCNVFTNFSATFTTPGGTGAQTIVIVNQ